MRKMWRIRERRGDRKMKRALYLLTIIFSLLYASSCLLRMPSVVAAECKKTCIEIRTIHLYVMYDTDDWPVAGIGDIYVKAEITTDCGYSETLTTDSYDPGDYGLGEDMVEHVSPNPLKTDCVPYKSSVTVKISVWDEDTLWDDYLIGFAPDNLGGHAHKSFSGSNTNVDVEFSIDTSPCVGGIVVSVDKFGLLAPYIGLASTTAIGAVATVVYVRRAKRREEKQ